MPQGFSPIRAFGPIPKALPRAWTSQIAAPALSTGPEIKPGHDRGADVGRRRGRGVVGDQVRFAISPARKPALAESSTITWLRNGWRVQLANSRRSATSVDESIFACLPGIVKGFEEY